MEFSNLIESLGMWSGIFVAYTSHREELSYVYKMNLSLDDFFSVDLLMANGLFSFPIIQLFFASFTQFAPLKMGIFQLASAKPVAVYAFTVQPHVTQNTTVIVMCTWARTLYLLHTYVPTT